MNWPKTWLIVALILLIMDALGITLEWRKGRSIRLAILAAAALVNYLLAKAAV